MKPPIMKINTLLSCFCLLATAAFAIEPTMKKLIHFGWHEPHQLKEYQKAPFEQLYANVPFDGIGFRPLFEIKRDGKTIRYKLGRPPKTGLIMLQKDDFKEWIPVFRRLKAETRLKYNFFDLSAILFSPDWFDEKAWELTMNNFTTMAWLAKESGFAGLALDIEAYSFGGYPFAYNPKFGHTYEETALQVRKRARQWIEGITKEFPDMHLHCCYWTSMCSNEGMAMHPTDYGKYAFAVQFFNGVYDGAPDTIQIHDGMESQGYKASGESAYTQIVADFHRFGPAWISPENIDKYRRLTRLSIPLYLDSYFKRPNPGPYTLYDTTDNPTKLLFDNTRHVMNYSDEFAWFWCEHGTFWPEITGDNPDAPFWNQRIPFAKEAIEAACNPYESALKNCGPILNNNPELTPSAGYTPEKPNTNIPEWNVWHEDNNPAGKGTVFLENGGVRFKQTANGAISQGFKNFKPGDTFLLTARGKLETNAMTPNVNIFYRNSKGEGQWELSKSAFFDIDEGNGWKRAMLIFQVPQRRDLVHMAICVSVTGRGNYIPKEDAGLFFDDVELHKISMPWDAPQQAVE